MNELGTKAPPEFTRPAFSLGCVLLYFLRSQQLTLVTTYIVYLLNAMYSGLRIVHCVSCFFCQSANIDIITIAIVLSPHWLKKLPT